MSKYVLVVQFSKSGVLGEQKGPKNYTLIKCGGAEIRSSSVVFGFGFYFLLVWLVIFCLGLCVCVFVHSFVLFVRFFACLGDFFTSEIPFKKQK